MAARSAASAVCRMLIEFNRILTRSPTGLPHRFPPSPQPSSFVTICFSADTPLVARDQTSHRQGCRVGTRCSVHEGNPRDALSAVSQEQASRSSACRVSTQPSSLPSTFLRTRNSEQVGPYTSAALQAHADISLMQESRNTRSGLPFLSSTLTRSLSAELISSCQCTRMARWPNCSRRRTFWSLQSRMPVSM
jgi:hypothetical protein